MTLTGYTAIAYARKHGLTLSKYADSTEGKRYAVPPDEAAEIAAREGENLIYLEVEDMSVQDKLDANYYMNRDILLYREWIANKKCNPETGKRVLCGTSYDEFYTDCLKELGIADHPKASIFFNHCWDDGHSSGYHEAWNILQNWIDVLI